MLEGFISAFGGGTPMGGEGTNKIIYSPLAKGLHPLPGGGIKKWSES